VPSARDIIPAVKRRIESAREHDIPVIYVCDAHAQDDAEFRAWSPHAVRNTKGAEVIEDLAPRPGDPVIEKTTYSAFYDTDLERILKDRGIRRITLAGILTNICIYYAAMEAMVRGYDVQVATDSVATLTARDHEFALEQMDKILKVKML
jgi:nicotinamidase-related amidase